ncbi:MAG: high-affinity nickel-transport family protein [Myxococcales bacterium]|nr:MAG: high-affinity nickel-transport family protein [Myxococcales bacterium]
MTLLAVLALGFFLGMRHATDSDHVLAVSTIVSRERTPRGALWIGALWGLGHSATIIIVGGAIVLFGWVIPPRLGLSMEMSVAVMLVVLGVINLSGALSQIERVAHAHRAPLPVANGAPPLVASVRPHLHARGAWRPLIIGVVHGLAGSAAVALLVLATIKNASTALLYLAIFGLGTVAGMMLLTVLMSLPISALARRFPNSERGVARFAGVLSIAFGLFLAYQIGIGSGLVVGTPTWDPH